MKPTVLMCVLGALSAVLSFGQARAASLWQGECRTGGAEVCVLSQDLLTEEDHWLTTLRIELRGDEAALQALLPAGVHIGSGIFYAVDGASRSALDYIRCNAEVCEASRALSAAEWGALRKGQRLELLFRAAVGEPPSLVDVSLAGVTAASRAVRP